LLGYLLSAHVLKEKKKIITLVPESKCPELLANYCDMLLRKTPLSKKLTSDEVEAKLKDVLLVLKYVQVKWRKHQSIFFFSICTKNTTTL
jgi:cullin-5